MPLLLAKIGTLLSDLREILSFFHLPPNYCRIPFNADEEKNSGIRAFRCFHMLLHCLQSSLIQKVPRFVVMRLEEEVDKTQFLNCHSILDTDR